MKCEKCGYDDRGTGDTAHVCGKVAIAPRMTITREQIIAWAREAEYAIRKFDGVDEVMEGDNYHIQTDRIEHFAALIEQAVRQDEREQCAKLVNDNALACAPGSMLQIYLASNAAAIRARGNA